MMLSGVWMKCLTDLPLGSRPFETAAAKFILFARAKESCRARKDCVKGFSWRTKTANNLRTFPAPGTWT
jgi:hypothetical protein